MNDIDAIVARLRAAALNLNEAMADAHLANLEVRLHVDDMNLIGKDFPQKCIYVRVLQDISAK